MNNLFSILNTPKLITGRGSLEFFTTLGKKRIGVIYDGRILNSELGKRLEALAQESGVEIRFLADIRNEPFIEDIFHFIKEINEYEPDLLLAIGGGSVLDTAKAIHLFYENPEMTLEEAFVPFALPQLGKKAVMVAVPTTSGTGSETTSVAVFIDSKSQQKKLMMSNNIIPMYAILDADMTDTLPDTVATYTGMDALTHAMEASVSKNASPMVQSIALSAALDIFENLPISISKTVDEQSKKAAREKVHIAAAMAGVAITNSCAGLAHSFDQPGPFFGLPHGMVCGIMLPYSTGICCPNPIYAVLAKRLGYIGNETELCKKLVKHIFNFTELIGLKRSYKELGIEEKVYMDHMDEFVKAALPAMATKMAPIDMNYELGIKMLKAAYYGNIL